VYIINLLHTTQRCVGDLSYSPFFGCPRPWDSKLRDFRLFFENGSGPPLVRVPGGDDGLPDDISNPFLVVPSSCFVFIFSDRFAFLNTLSSFTGIFSADVSAKSALESLSVCRLSVFWRSLLGVCSSERSIWVGACPDGWYELSKQIINYSFVDNCCCFSAAN